MNCIVIPTGEGKDRPSLSPIPVAYVCVFCICIYVDKNFVINIIIKTTTVECQNQKYCQEGPQSRTYGVLQTKLHPESHNQMNCNEV